MPLPDGRVDAASTDEVAAVLGSVITSMGTEGLLDVLGRVPGVTIQPGRPGGLFRKAEPLLCWVGPEDRLVVAGQLLHEQVVRGVVLHSAALPPGTAPATIARLLVRHVAQMAAYDDASIALTGAREATGSV